MKINRDDIKIASLYTMVSLYRNGNYIIIHCHTHNPISIKKFMNT